MATWRLASSLYVHLFTGTIQSEYLLQKHHAELFPDISETLPEVFALAALFVTVRDRPTATVPTSPWNSLGPRRFGGEPYERIISFQTDSQASPTVVHLLVTPSDTFDVTVSLSSGKASFSSVPASLLDSSTLFSTLNGAKLRTTIVSQLPPPTPTASASAMIAERLYVFHGGHKTTLLLPAPKWLQEKGSAVLEATTGGIRAPMPSLVVEVKVNLGDKVERGQAIVILESMKTETVLRAEGEGSVKRIECKGGEMVGEGKELVEIEYTMVL